MTVQARGGFTMVELLIVVLIVGILARIAMPSYQQITNRARAAAALGDLRAIRQAAFEYNADTGTWPADMPTGRVPPELDPYLGAGFSFDREHYSLDWENWEAGGAFTRTGVLLGVSIRTPEEHVGQALLDLVGPNMATMSFSNHYTFIIAAR